MLFIFYSATKHYDDFDLVSGGLIAQRVFLLVSKQLGGSALMWRTLPSWAVWFVPVEQMGQVSTARQRQERLDPEMAKDLSARIALDLSMRQHQIII